MKYKNLKPELENLSQGKRIAFIRQFRNLTQDEVSEKLGLGGENKRRTMCRYESGERGPSINRTKELAKLFNVNLNSIKKYDFDKSEDLIYILLWLEELYPKMKIDFCIFEQFQDNRDKMILKFKKEWDYMRNLRDTREIPYSKYLEWKLNYDVKEG